MTATHQEHFVCSPRLREVFLEYLRDAQVPLCPGVDGLTVDDMLDCYAILMKKGVVPNWEQLIENHPDLTKEIGMFFYHQFRDHGIN